MREATKQKTQFQEKNCGDHIFSSERYPEIQKNLLMFFHAAKFYKNISCR